METKKILVVDDEPDLVELVAYNLRKEGFTVSKGSTPLRLSATEFKTRRGIGYYVE